MKINIFEQEISDGIADQISNNSIYCQSIAKASQVMFPELESLTDEELEKIGSSMAGKKGQFDLYNLESVLVSTGWNKNDDVFDRKELWLARETPEDKPFNFMHNEKDIIGHITGNRVVDKSGVEIYNEDDLPEDFDILTTAVIYKEWSDLEQRSRMSKIISEIEDIIANQHNKQEEGGNKKEEEMQQQQLGGLLLDGGLVYAVLVIGLVILLIGLLKVVTLLVLLLLAILLLVK